MPPPRLFLGDTDVTSLPVCPQHPRVCLGIPTAAGLQQSPSPLHSWGHPCLRGYLLPLSAPPRFSNVNMSSTYFISFFSSVTNTAENNTDDLQINQLLIHLTRAVCCWTCIRLGCTIKSNISQKSNCIRSSYLYQLTLQSHKENRLRVAGQEQAPALLQV